MMTTETDYQKQANEFCEKYSLKITFKYVGHDYYFENDKDTRDIYRWKIRNQKTLRECSGRFGQSIADSLCPNHDEHKHDCSYAHRTTNPKMRQPKAPTPYDLLACVQKSEPEDIDTFAAEMGFTKPREAIASHAACVKEYNDLRRVIPSEAWDDLCEIS